MTPQVAIARLVERRPLATDEMVAVLDAVLAGDATPAQVGALLVALRMKGETVEELTGVVRALRGRVTPISGVPEGAVDTCGTGGSGRRTFNVSTAVALVTAACGVPVAKHGNRAVSGRTGSADVLEALGVAVELPAEALGRCLRDVGIAFLFAPALHPALRHVAGARRELGIRTCFNLAAPLANPAAVRRQVVGVSEERLVPLLAGVLDRVGCARAWVVHGPGGLDELGLSGPSTVAVVAGGRIDTRQVAPEDAGLRRTADDDGLAADGPAASAARIRDVLGGMQGTARDLVCLNAAAALVVAGAVSDLRAGAARAAAAVDEGTAAGVLERLAAFTRAEAARASARAGAT